MQTTRIILIDISGSMNSSFGRRIGNRKTHRLTKNKQKFEAARQYLLATVTNSQSQLYSTNLIIISFAEIASVVYQGSISNQGEILFAISKLEPTGGTTNLASAFQLTINILNQSSSFTIKSLEIITDGLSSKGGLFSLANFLREEMGIFFYIYLIDNTDEGYRIAEQIVGKNGGKIVIIEDESNLLNLVASGNNQTHKKPRFSIVYPEKISFDKWHWVFFWMYNQEFSEYMKSKINRLLQEFNDLDYEKLSVNVPCLVPLGSPVKIEINSKNLEITPKKIEFEWSEDLHEFHFRIKTKQSIEKNENLILLDDADFNIGIFVNNLPVQNVSVLVTISEDSSTLGSITDFNWVEKIFASYSELDNDIVEDFKEKYKVLGISMFTGAIQFRNPIVRGQELPALFDIIESSDMFQLFWSSSAQQCADVKREWEKAIELIREKKKRKSFFKAVYWEEPLPPLPLEIASMEFHKLQNFKFESKIREDLMKAIESQSSKPITINNNNTNTAIAETKSIEDTFNIDQSNTINPNTFIAKDHAKQQVNISDSPQVLFSQSDSLQKSPVLFDQQATQELFEKLRQFIRYNPKLDDQGQKEALQKVKMLIDLSKEEKEADTQNKVINIVSILREIISEGSSFEAGLKLLAKIVELFEKN